LPHKGNDLFRISMNTAKSIALLLLTILPQTSYAAYKTYENTWFEIEVILFKQLGDKSQLQEVFPETSTLPQHDKVISLLKPYLAPTFEEVKTALPLCNHFPQYANEPVDKLESVDGLTVVDNEYGELLIETEKRQAEEKRVAAEELKKAEALKEQLRPTDETLNAETILTGQVFSETVFINQQPEEEANTPTKPERYNVNQTIIDLKGPTFLTSYETEAPTEDRFYSPETTCEVSRLKAPELIVGEEDLTGELPYIINDDSLKLHDIVKQLKRSRSFRPLLHMGWRQITRLKSAAIPLKVSAGDNLVANYLTELSKYNAALEKQTLEQLIENGTNGSPENSEFSDVSNTYLNNANLNNAENNEAINGLQPVLNDSLQLETSEINSEEIALKLAEILSEAKSQTHDFDAVLAELNGDDSDSQYISSPLNIEGESNIIAPLYPPQNWSIDGFLKVEVQRYLHITADFNVVNMSIAEQATQQLSNSEPIPLKSIRFQQNKRVKSNEIHYFDHPYMGMIIQIRRHNQLPPETEEMNSDVITEPLTNVNAPESKKL